MIASQNLRQPLLHTLQPSFPPAHRSLFCTLLQKSEAHPLSFQSSPHSLQKHRGWHRVSGFVLANPELDKERTLNSDSPRGSAYSAPLRCVPLLRLPLSTFSVSTLSPVESALTEEFRVLPCFGRSCQRVSRSESALTESSLLSLLESALTEKRLGVGDIPLVAQPLLAVLRRPQFAVARQDDIGRPRRTQRFDFFGVSIFLPREYPSPHTSNSYKEAFKPWLQQPQSNRKSIFLQPSF